MCLFYKPNLKDIEGLRKAGCKDIVCLFYKPNLKDTLTLPADDVPLLVL